MMTMGIVIAAPSILHHSSFHHVMDFALNFLTFPALGRNCVMHRLQHLDAGLRKFVKSLESKPPNRPAFALAKKHSNQMQCQRKDVGERAENCEFFISIPIFRLGIHIKHMSLLI